MSAASKRTGQQAACGHRRHAETHAPALALRAEACLRLEILGVDKQQGRALGDRAAFGREVDAAAVPVEQPDAELSFERLDGSAQGRQVTPSSFPSPTRCLRLRRSILFPIRIKDGPEMHWTYWSSDARFRLALSDPARSGGDEARPPSNRPRRSSDR